MFDLQCVDPCLLQVFSPGSFVMQWMGPCYAAYQDIPKDHLFHQTLLARPLILEVIPDIASAVGSTWQQSAVLCTAGIPVTLALSVSDKFGNAVSSCCDALELVDISRVFSHVRGCCVVALLLSDLLYS